jgi:hypothetical protein
MHYLNIFGDFKKVHYQLAEPDQPEQRCTQPAYRFRSSSQLAGEFWHRQSQNIQPVKVCRY